MKIGQVIIGSMCLLVSAVLMSEFLSLLKPLILGILIGLLLTLADFISGLKIWNQFMEWVEEVTDNDSENNCH